MWPLPCLPAASPLFLPPFLLSQPGSRASPGSTVSSSARVPGPQQTGSRGLPTAPTPEPAWAGPIPCQGSLEHLGPPYPLASSVPPVCMWEVLAEDLLSGSVNDTPTWFQRATLSPGCWPLWSVRAVFRWLGLPAPVLCPPVLPGASLQLCLSVSSSCGELCLLVFRVPALLEGSPSVLQVREAVVEGDGEEGGLG